MVPWGCGGLARGAYAAPLCSTSLSNSLASVPPVRTASIFQSLPFFLNHMRTLTSSTLPATSVDAFFSDDDDEDDGWLPEFDDDDEDDADDDEDDDEDDAEDDDEDDDATGVKR